MSDINSTAADEMFEKRIEVLYSTHLGEEHMRTVEEVLEVARIPTIDAIQRPAIYDAIANLAVKSFEAGKKAQRDIRLVKAEEGWYD